MKGSLVTGIMGILTVALLAAPDGAEAQPASKLARIGVLRTGASPDPNVDAFRLGLRELGYVEGQTVTLEYRWAGGRADRLPRLATELIEARVDVIVTAGEAAIVAAQRATTTIPIVFTSTSDPVGSGLVVSLARPGGNITGLSMQNPELTGKRFELLKETLPKARRIAVTWNPARRGMDLRFKQAEPAARAFGFALQWHEVRSSGDFDRLRAALERDRPDALMAFTDSVVFSQRKHLLEIMAKVGTPAMYETREWVEAGGLMAYGPHLPDLFRRSAGYVDKILKGARPADLPIQQPTKFELVINLRTAKAIGLTIPRPVLLRADDVIQ